MLSRLVKADEGVNKIAASKDLMLKLFVYYSIAETNKSALITIHTLCNKHSDFRGTLLNTHKFTLASFDSFVSSGIANFKRTVETDAWDEYVNVVASLTAFVGLFPERLEDF